MNKKAVEIIENLPDFWTSVKKEVVIKLPDRKACLNWGAQILRAWKDAPKIDKENQGVERRKEVENEIIMDLFYCAVFTKKPYSQRFIWMIDAFLEELNPTKKMQAMYFRCTMPVIWRNLEVQNEEIRIAASSLILNFYPLTSDDEFLRDDYLKKQQDAMAQMLMDPCVPIRILAIKKLPFHFCNNWKNFPRELIKQCLERLVDNLSLDSLPEVRAAVYEGMENLLPSPDALTANQRSLEILSKRGINDKTEKVRLAAFRMLTKLHGHRYLKLLDLIEMKDVLLRLDFEHSSSVQNQIIKLIHRAFIPSQVEGIDYQERFKRIYYICEHSSNASLHFHHRIYPLELISMEMAVHHIRSLLLGVKGLLRKIVGDDGADDTSDTLRLNSTLSSTSTIVEEQKTDEKLRVAKDVLDSAIVLWMAIRFDLFIQKNAVINGEVIKMMSNILETLNQFTNNSGLMESALVIARHLPKDKVGRLYGRIKGKMETEDSKQPHFSHYVEALASWDMNMLIGIIERGLRRFRNELISVTDPNQQMSTPRRKLANPMRESPPTKKVKITDVLEDHRRPLELIQILLSCPLTSQELQKNFIIHLEGFLESLFIIRRQFGSLLLMPDWEKKFSPQLLYAAYETLNILELITKKIEEPRKNNRGEDEANERELDLPINDRLLYTEMKWFASIIIDHVPSFQVIKMFLRCLNLHLTSGQLEYLILNETANMLIRIKRIIEDMYDADSVELALQKSADYLKEALENCEDAERAQRTISQKVIPLLEELEETQQGIQAEDADERDEE